MLLTDPSLRTNLLPPRRTARLLAALLLMAAHAFAGSAVAQPAPPRLRGNALEIERALGPRLVKGEVVAVDPAANSVTLKTPTGQKQFQKGGRTIVRRNGQPATL